MPQQEAMLLGRLTWFVGALTFVISLIADNSQLTIAAALLIAGATLAIAVLSRPA